MTDVTRTLSEIESADPISADELRPLVCEELRELVAAKPKLVREMEDKFNRWLEEVKTGG